LMAGHSLSPFSTRSQPPIARGCPGLRHLGPATRHRDIFANCINHGQSFVRKESKVCCRRPCQSPPCLRGPCSNLGPSYNVTPEELFDLFGKYGPIRYVDLARHVSRGPSAYL
jgi:hypothetical protein